MDDMGLLPFSGFVTTYPPSLGSAIGLLPCSREHPFGRNFKHGRLRYHNANKLPGEFLITSCSLYSLIDYVRKASAIFEMVSVSFYVLRSQFPMLHSSRLPTLPLLSLRC